MTITKIEQLGKSRYQIYADHNPIFVLYRGELKKYKIDENTELSDEMYSRIVEEVLVKRVRLRTMNLLMKHSFTIRQLRNKLSDGGYSDELIDNAIEYVSSYGYVNDKNYALDYIQSHRSDKSRKRIINDLIGKGIGKADIETAFREAEELDGDIDEESQIMRLLEKKHYLQVCSDYNEVCKIMSFLMRKGFDLDTVKKTMKKLNFMVDTEEY